jgi:hypothetical protein
MGQGQYKLDSAAVGELNKIDNAITKLIENEDTYGAEIDLESRFKEKLGDMISLVTREGKEVEPKEILVSDFILPPVDSTIRETRRLFSGEGLLPG